MSPSHERIDVEDVTPAGGFSAWLERTRHALASDDGADVPCGDCTACCTASYYVYVRPDETRTLARIPRDRLVSLPGLPAGYLAMDWDARGHCPMLVEGRCSIYEDRPQTCRDFDCRIFPASGIDPAEKPLIAERARHWRFDHPTPRDRREHAAVRAAAAFLRDHADAFETWAIPRNPNLLAVLAIKASPAFEDEPERARHEAAADVARAVVAAVRRFESTPTT
jgi:Fe-S-cluster containining protein